LNSLTISIYKRNAILRQNGISGRFLRLAENMSLYGLFSAGVEVVGQTIVA
jgi:hypothetical protein